MKLLIAVLMGVVCGCATPGRDGLPGVPGVQGEKGETGIPGESGPQGKPGSQGLPGMSGVQGAPGMQGATGAEGPAGPTGKVWTDGSRLQALTFTGEDGSTGFIGWYDTLLQARCEFGHIDDNDWRCIPAPVRDVRTIGQPYYADAQCTKMAIYPDFGAVGVAPYFFYRWVYDWDQSIHIFAIQGDAVTGFVHARNPATGMCTNGPNIGGTAVTMTE